jgi:hypothetical protein
MRIEDFKRWHWCVIGLLVGAVVAAVHVWVGPAEAYSTHNDSGGPQRLEEQLLKRHHSDRRVVAAARNFRIHPPTEIPVPGAKVESTEFISYEVLVRKARDSKTCDILPQQVILQQRTKHKSVLGDISKMTAHEYLTKLKAYCDKINKDHPGAVLSFDYRYNWLETPRAAFTVFPAAGLLVIGLIWPSILGLLVHAGFGRPPEEDGVDLSKYKSRGREPEKKRAGLTHADAEELARLEAELEAKLRSGEAGVTTASTDGKPTATPPPAPRVLEAGPLEQPKEPAKPKAPKGYGADQGDYYPTEVHGKPKR